jgi:hypothetical protein
VIQGLVRRQGRSLVEHADMVGVNIRLQDSCSFDADVRVLEMGLHYKSLGMKKCGTAL